MSHQTNTTIVETSGTEKIEVQRELMSNVLMSNVTRCAICCELLWIQNKAIL
jgi:hypothetical protein